MSENPSEWADLGDDEMPDPSPIRIRARQLYALELDYAADDQPDEPIDLVRVRARAARRLASEFRAQPLALAQLAVHRASATVNRTRAPKFKPDGSVRLTFYTMLRVADDTVVPARYAREDDWLAYATISRRNRDRIVADDDAKQLGVARIVGDLRAAGHGAQTYAVRPDLFDDGADEASSEQAR